MSSFDLTKVSVLSLAFTLAMFAHYTLKTWVEAEAVMTFGSVGPSYLILIEFAAVVLILSLLPAGRHFGLKPTAILAVVTTSACALLLCWPIVRRPLPSNIGVTLLFLSSSLLVSVAVYLGWTLVTSCVADLRRSWLYLTVFGLGAQFGVLGAAWGHSGIGALPFRYPQVASLAYLIAFTVFLLAARFSAVFQVTGTASSHVDGLRGAGAVARLAIWHPALRWVVILLCLQVFVTELIRWKVFQAVQRSDSVKQAAVSLSVYYANSAYISIAAQLLVVPFALGVVRMRAALLVQPLLALGAVVLITLVVSASTTHLVVAAYMSLLYTLNNAVREETYVMLPLSIKIAARMPVAVAVPKIGTALGALTILALQHAAPRAWPLVAAAGSLTWLVAAVRLGRAARDPVSPTALSDGVALATFDSSFDKQVREPAELDGAAMRIGAADATTLRS